MDQSLSGTAQLLWTCFFHCTRGGGNEYRVRYAAWVYLLQTCHICSSKQMMFFIRQAPSQNGVLEQTYQVVQGDIPERVCGVYYKREGVRVGKEMTALRGKTTKKEERDSYPHPTCSLYI